MPRWEFDEPVVLRRAGGSSSVHFLLWRAFGGGIVLDASPYKHRRMRIWTLHKKETGALDQESYMS